MLKEKRKNRGRDKKESMQNGFYLVKRGTTLIRKKMQRVNQCLMHSLVDSSGSPVPTKQQQRYLRCSLHISMVANDSFRKLQVDHLNLCQIESHLWLSSMTLVESQSNEKFLLRPTPKIQFPLHLLQSIDRSPAEAVCLQLPLMDLALAAQKLTAWILMTLMWKWQVDQSMNFIKC